MVYDKQGHANEVHNPGGMPDPTLIDHIEEPFIDATICLLYTSVMKIGWPEGRIPLAEATVYLATSPKSNSAYEGIGQTRCV